MMEKNRMIMISAFIVVVILVGSCSETKNTVDATRPPNIIFILADDLSWGDLGCYGQTKIETPNIDRIAAEGMLFTQAYAGNSVCAPSRSCLMEGKHPGHARVRGNAYNGYRESLQPGDTTVAMLLQKAGYKTGLFGKWGLANHDQPGVPNAMGYDEFYGYLNQQQAHTYYPEFLYHNEERVYYPENADHYKLENYSKPSSYDAAGNVIPNGIEDPGKAKNSFDVYAEKTLDFIRENQDVPFFLNLSYTLPHGPLIVPDLGLYKDKDWEIQYKEWAAMVTYLDDQVGRVLGLIEELGLDEQTLIFFASDNGNSSYGYEARYLEVKEGPTLEEFFRLTSPTRGRKGDTYDGAFHVPAMVRWPGKIAPNQKSDHLWAFWDFLPTAAEIAHVKPPADIDGISFLPTLLGEAGQKKHDYLYWEFNQHQALRTAKWFAHRKHGGAVELYDLEKDPQQRNDLAAINPDVVRKIEQWMQESHRPSDVWPSPGETKEAFEQRLRVADIPPRPNNLSDY